MDLASVMVLKFDIRKSQLIDNISLWTHNERVQLQEIKL